MKNFNLALFLGCCVIGICITISGVLISNKLPETPHFPANLSVTTASSQTEFEDFLSEYEVAVFLKISQEDLTKLIVSGELDPYCTKINDTYVFSKVALEGWMNDRISGPY